MPSPVPPQVSDPIIVRRAQLSDAAAIGELGGRVFKGTYGHAIGPDDLVIFLKETYATSAITQDLKNDSIDVIIASDKDGRLAGFAYLTRGSTDPCIDQFDNKVELQRLYVDTSVHGKGIGGLLGKRVEEMARDQGFKHLWVGVWEHAKAKKIYEKWGFQHVGEHDFNMGLNTIHTDLILLKELA